MPPTFPTSPTSPTSSSAAHATGTVFLQLYLLWVGIAVLCTHGAINRYARVVPLNSTFGHWYYPLAVKHHTSFCGWFVVPRLRETQRHALVVLFLCLIAAASWLPPFTSYHFPLHLATAIVSVLYFAQARTHGLIHNKADLVPWCFLLIGCSTNGAVVCGNIRVLMGVVYFSSGLMKLRLTGLRWASGTNLQRMVLQFLCELRMPTPNVIQKLLLKHHALATLAQTMALGYEVTFLLAVVVGEWYGGATMAGVWWMYGVYGFSFHFMIFQTMSIDFLRFWCPGLISMVLPWCVSVPEGSGVGVDLPCCVVVVVCFSLAHARNHDGTHWPLSSFDLYNKVYASDVVQYTVLNVLRRSKNDDTVQEIPFDLSLCSSSGITRSFGWTSVKMPRKDKRRYLQEFLPLVLQEELGAEHCFVGVKELNMRVELNRRTGEVDVQYRHEKNMIKEDWRG